MSRAHGGGGVKLVVDPTACTGHGLCAELFPEGVELDDWGYPIVRGDVDPALAEHARRAVKACPALALTLSATSQRKPRVRGR